jgi:hypothetical protein
MPDKRAINGWDQRLWLIGFDSVFASWRAFL